MAGSGSGGGVIEMYLGIDFFDVGINTVFCAAALKFSIFALSEAIDLIH